MNKINLIILIISITYLLTGCEDQEKNKLDNRVIDYWNYKINKEYNKAYEFTTPGYKKTMSQVAFELKLSSSPLKWTGVKIQNKKCSKPDFCIVELLVKYKYKMGGGMSGSREMEVETPKKDKWLLKNNVWYILIK